MAVPHLTVTGGSATFNAAVSLTDSIRVTGGTLTLLGGAAITIPRLVISNGTLGGSDSVTVTGSLAWSGGTQSGAGVTRLLSSSTATLSGGTKSLLQRTFDNQTTLVWTAGALNVGSGTSLRNRAGAVWTIQGDVGFGNVGGGATFLNEGTVEKTAGTGTSAITSGMAFTNSGTVDVQTGTLDLGTLTHNAGALITGTGTIDLPTTYTFNGNINPGSVGGAGTLTFIGNLLLGSSSVVTIDASGTAIPGVSYDQVVITSGSVTLNGTGTIAPFGGYTPTTGDLLTIIAGSSPPSGTWSVPGWTTQLSGNTVRVTRP